MHNKARIIVVDKNFKIIKDSFNIATGKYSVANDTIKAIKVKVPMSMTMKRNT